MTDEEKDLIYDLECVATANPKLAALTILNLRGLIDDMENNKVYVSQSRSKCRNPALTD